MTIFTKEQQKLLTKLRSQAAFAHRGVDPARPQVVCRLIETLTGRVWCSAIAATELAALTLVLQEANPGDLPQTPAEIAEENIRLRKENAALKGDPPTPPPQEVRHPVVADAPPEVEENFRRDVTVDDDDPMTVTQLVMALKSQNIPVPEGDKRKNEWRQKAEEALIIQV
jgi:hypothetical protein